MLLRCYAMHALPDRQGGCDKTRSRQPENVGRSFASVLCDAVIGHWLAMCARVRERVRERVRVRESKG